MPNETSASARSRKIKIEDMLPSGRNASPSVAMTVGGEEDPNLGQRTREMGMEGKTSIDSRRGSGRVETRPRMEI